jgi:type I restriction enzyme M protein
VNTNVLFFTRGEKDKGNTKEVWVYDLRTNMPTFGRRTQLTRKFFAQFESAFGEDPSGSLESLAKRTDTGEQGRFRPFHRAWISAQGDSLDILWLKDANGIKIDDLPEPSELAEQAMNELEAALGELQELLLELGREIE